MEILQKLLVTMPDAYVVVEADAIAKIYSTIPEDEKPSLSEIRTVAPRVAPPFSLMCICWHDVEFPGRMAYVTTVFACPFAKAVAKNQHVGRMLPSAHEDDWVIMLWTRMVPDDALAVSMDEANRDWISVDSAVVAVSRTDGSLIANRRGQFVTSLQELHEEGSGAPYARDPDGPKGVLDIPLMALAFMNAKNAELSDAKWTPSRAVRRRAKKAGEQEPGPVVYKILGIKMATRKQPGVASAPDMDAEKVRRSLHTCRGHFKEYTDKGLFGKHFGLFWVNDHQRGSKAKGSIEKDYRIMVSGDQSP